jgi:hypothetical protein
VTARPLAQGYRDARDLPIIVKTDQRKCDCGGRLEKSPPPLAISWFMSAP